jgi:N-acetylneuraminic acid mutarotase
MILPSCARAALLLFSLFALPASALACALHVAQALTDLQQTGPTAIGSSKLGAISWAGPAISGSWYAPSRSGEGIIVQALEDGSVIAIWFTFPPEGSSAKQAWILAQGGRIDGGRVRFDQVFTVRGPRFGPDFDPAARVIEPWGSLELNFTSCNEVELNYAGPASWGAATRTLQRLTSIDELGCDGKTRLTASGARAISGLRQRSAAWYDPSHSGEGWFIEELPNGQALSYWFTYDENGDQAWTVGVAAQSGDLLNIASSVRPIGTHFGSGFDASEIDRQAWGSYTLAFNSCSSGQLQYTSSLPGFGSGSLAPQRLTRLAGAVCLDSAPATPAGGIWTARATMPGAQSELATATLDGAFHVAGGFGAPRGFKRYDPQSNSWTTLADTPGARDHALAVNVAGSIYLTGGYSTTTGGDQANAGWKYLPVENRWEPVSSLPLFAASGAASFNGLAWFGNTSGELAQFDPRLQRRRIIPADASGGLRDHSQLVAFQGELWMIGGRSNIGETARVSIFDPASETWREGPSLQFPRGGFAAAASDSVLIVAGGEVVVSGLSVRNEVEAIVAGANSWTRLPDLPVAVHGVGGVISGNAFYALGGSTLAGGVRNGGDVQRYQWSSPTP